MATGIGTVLIAPTPSGTRFSIKATPLFAVDNIESAG